jgi:hypothetical protein
MVIWTSAEADAIGRAAASAARPKVGANARGTTRARNK